MHGTFYFLHNILYATNRMADKGLKPTIYLIISTNRRWLKHLIQLSGNEITNFANSPSFVSTFISPPCALIIS